MDFMDEVHDLLLEFPYAYKFVTYMVSAAKVPMPLGVYRNIYNEAKKMNADGENERRARESATVESPVEDPDSEGYAEQNDPECYGINETKVRILQNMYDDLPDGLDATEEAKELLEDAM